MNFESNQKEKPKNNNNMENNQENKEATFLNNSPSKMELKSPSQKMSPNSLLCSNCESSRSNKACSFKFCQRCCQLYQQEKEGKLTCLVSAHRLQIRSLEKFYQSSEEESEEKDYEEDEEDSLYYDDESTYDEEEESYSEESDYEEEKISIKVQTKSPNKSQTKEETKNQKVEKEKDKKNYNKKEDKRKTDIKEEKNELEIKKIKDERKNEKNTNKEGSNQIEIKSEKNIEIQEKSEETEGKNQVEIKQEKNIQVKDEKKKGKKEQLGEKTKNQVEIKQEKKIELKNQKQEIENTQNQASKKSEDIAQSKLQNIIITKQVDSPYRKVETDSQIHENKKYEENNNNHIYRNQSKEENRNRDYEERNRERNRYYENRPYERDYDDKYYHREENMHRDYDDKYYRETNRNYGNRSYERDYDPKYSHGEENMHRDYGDRYSREKNRNYENESCERDYSDRYQNDYSKKHKYEEQNQTEIHTLGLEKEMVKLNITDNEKSKVDSFDRNTYKIYPCPQGNKCVKLKCVYYHNDKDRRRNLQLLPLLCKEITKYRKCSYGDNCKYAHNQFEFHFTEQNYKSKECNFYLENGYCRFEECCAYIHKPDDRIQAVIDLLKTYEKKHFIELRNLLPPEIQQNLARSFYPFLGGFRGWKEEGFATGDKKLLKEKLSKVKAKMAQYPMTEVYAAQLRYVDPKSGNFPAMMNYARIVAEEIGKTELGQNKSSVKHLVRTIKYNTNWAHHSQDEGEPLFSVTPRNQEEAIDALMKLTEELIAYYTQTQK